MSDTPSLDPRFIAAVDLLGRTGVKQLRVAYSDEEQGLPVVWWAAGSWKEHGYEAAAALDPATAVLRLCERVIDGAECTHCHKPTMFEMDMPIGTALDAFADALMCVYAWDPELSTFRRGCAGDTVLGVGVTG